jgi:hypothetical protein
MVKMIRRTMLHPPLKLMAGVEGESQMVMKMRRKREMAVTAPSGASVWGSSIKVGGVCGLAVRTLS